MLGVDLVSVQRISRLCEREWYRRFWFDENERDRLGSSAHADESYAAGVAMKEAVMKAFGRGFGQGVKPRMITLEWSSAGRPRASLQGHRFAVSATHSDGYAVATALDLGGIR